jgi:hypothetical protein
MRQTGWYMIHVRSGPFRGWQLAHWQEGPITANPSGWTNKSRQLITGMVDQVIEVQVSIPIPDQEEIWTSFTAQAQASILVQIRHQYYLIPKDRS